MEIRVLVESDAHAWWELRREALENEPAAFGKTVEEHISLGVEGVARRLRELGPADFYLGAFSGGTLVGMATFIREPSIKESHKGHLYGMYVTPAHRGKRLAGALLRELIEKARPSVEQILLAVATNREAPLRLYKGLGFEIFGTEERALKIGETYVDEHHMVLRLR